jgi:hypothetical protein
MRTNTRTSDGSSYSCCGRDEERSPLAAIARKLRSELEYIRLVRPTAFVRAVVLDARPEAAVAYEEADVREELARSGLRIATVRYGVWSGRSDGVGWQDVVVAERRS